MNGPYRFSDRSRRRLDECHDDLVTVMEHVIKHVDIMVLEGQRGKERQNQLVEQGKSKAPWPQSKHNAGPGTGRTKSHAVDILPSPFDGNDTDSEGIGWANRSRFHYVGGIVIGVARELQRRGTIAHRVRWGGDWNQNNNPADQSFYDGPHFELVDA